MFRQAQESNGNSSRTPDLFPEVEVKRASTARSPIVGAEGLLGSVVVDSQGHRVGELLDIWSTCTRVASLTAWSFSTTPRTGASV